MTLKKILKATTRIRVLGLGANGGTEHEEQPNPFHQAKMRHEEC